MNEAEMTTQDHFEEELGVISHLDIQKHFAKGVVLLADNDLDIVQVAMAMHADDADQIQTWVEGEKLIRAHDEHAKAWVAARSVFKAVTVAPWVLVQEVSVSDADVIEFMKNKSKENH